MSYKKDTEASYERWQTVFAGSLVVIGLVYSIAAIFQWITMKEQAGRMEEQSRAMAQQLEIMRADIENTKASRSADFILRFDEKLDRKPYTDITIAIGHHKLILREHGGRFSDVDLDSYLSIFESLHDVYVTGLISEQMLYNSYSYEIENASNNAEVREYLRRIRKEDPDFFSGFEDLTIRFRSNPASVKP